jgi:putative addiction module component (TIGR02574 family)
MTVTIELPQNKKEAAFVLQLLKRLNLSFTNGHNTELPEELQELLTERLADLKANPHDVVSWEDIKKHTFDSIST